MSSMVRGGRIADATAAGEVRLFTLRRADLLAPIAREPAGIVLTAMLCAP